MDNTLQKLQNQWNLEGVRILIIASLSIQIGLMFLAPLRKRTSNKVLALTIWLFYLTAELVPPLALGSMGKQLIDPVESGDSETITGDLTILWASFLLLHIGGPDTITSYSTNDNELWWRHPLGLVVQVVAAVYAFWQSPPNPVLSIPTTLVCIAGMIKFIEKTHALRLGSRDNLKDKIMREIRMKNKTRGWAFRRGESIRANETEAQLSESERESRAISEAYSWFHRFKRLLIDVTFSPTLLKRSHCHFSGINMRYILHFIGWGMSMGERIPGEGAFLSESERESQAISEAYSWFHHFKRLLVDVTFFPDLFMGSHGRFSVISTKEAMNLIAIELSFLYDILHTKAPAKHCALGRLLHCSSLVSIIAAFVVFHHLDMQKYASKDIIITYILFGAGLALDVIATFLLVSSDWTVVYLTKMRRTKCIAPAIVAAVKKTTFGKGKSRWSKTIGQYNLVGLCLRDRYVPHDTWIMGKLIKIKHKWDNMRESKLITLPELLEDYMFREAKRRAPNMQDYMPSEATKRGPNMQDYMLSEATKRGPNMHIYNEIAEARSYRGRKALKHYGQLKNLGWSVNREFDQCIIMWHVATDICYYKDTSGQPKENESECTVSWVTSNYMVYLLTQKQSMMQLGHGQMRFEVTCDVVRKIFKNQRKLDDEKARQVIYDKEDPIDFTADDMEKDRQLFLRDCRRLAKELHNLDQNIKWKLIIETWMEMLGYAAIHCDSYQHAKALSRGGELLTNLWLLMAHLGIVGEQKMPKIEPDEIV